MPQSFPDTINRFGYELIPKLTGKDHRFISSFSIAQAFAFILNGASESNAVEIKRAFGWDSVSIDEINENFIKKTLPWFNTSPSSEAPVSDFGIEPPADGSAPPAPAPASNPAPERQERRPAIERFKLHDSDSGSESDFNFDLDVGEDLFIDSETGERTATNPSQKSKFQLEIANSVWVKESHAITESFKKTADEFRSKVDKLESVEQVNNWVNEITRGNIKTIIDSIQNVNMVVINAVFFKGEFVTPFKEYDTSPGIFYGTSGAHEVPTMYSNTTRPYLENKLFQAVKMPYKSPIGTNFEAIVFLPQKSSNLNEVLQWLGKNKMVFTEEKIRYYLPKVKLQYETSLMSQLQEKGMKEAFIPNHPFSSLSEPGDLYVTGVNHKTMLEIDEKGTTAAAVTSMKLRQKSAKREEKIIYMRVDHPFGLIIREEKTGLNLFCGVIEHLNGVPHQEESSSDEEEATKKDKKKKDCSIQ